MTEAEIKRMPDVIDDEVTVSDVLAQLPQEEAYANVERIQSDGTRSYVGRISAQELVADGVEAVRAKFGPGRYVLDIFAVPDHLRDAAPDKRRPRRACKRTVVIEQTPAPSSSPPVPAHAPDGLAAVAQTLQGLAESQRAMIDEMRNLRAAPQQGTGITEMITALKMLHEMTPEPPRTQAPAAPVDRFSEVKGIIELARELSGLPQLEEGKTDGWSLLAKTVEKILPTIERIAVAAGAPQQQPPIRHAPPSANPSTPGVPPVSPQPAPAAGVDVRPYVAMLMNSAGRNEDPYVWVGLILSRVPSDVVAKLVADPVGLLKAYDPRAEQFAPWLNDLAAALREEMVEDDATESPAGDAG